jgi:hypothetical protein
VIDDTVVVIRNNKGDDIISILCGEMNGKLKLEYPYFVKLEPHSGTFNMIPYCILSDEIFFELSTDNIEFVVPASDDISSKFLDMIDAHRHLDRYPSRPIDDTGNITIH